jgi:SAM-dependent methyltransferase
MYPSVMDFVERALPTEKISGAKVLEVGALGVNASVRSFIEKHHPAMYVGVDQKRGPNVDLVANCEQLVKHMGGDAWDIVVSTEMLWHVDNWRVCMRQMTWAVAPGGLLLVTTRSPGFPHHSSAVDNWRFTVNDMERIVEALKLQAVTIEEDKGPESPGVFMLARKPLRLHVPGSLENIWVGGASDG